jgi:anaerobic dimethyl sulfoxide reductase subunit B (iron-sulfur subunit)
MSVQLAFYFDQTRCGACNACTVACKDWNQVNPGPVAWRTQFTHETEDGFFPFAFGCNHCDNPACASSCPYEAITKSDEGIVTIDRNKCRSSLACINACPFAKPQIAGDKQEPNPYVGWQVRHPAQKCTMCGGDRLKNGLKPVCVISCVGRALDIGTVDYINDTYGSEPGFTRLNPDDFPYAYVNGRADTGPNLFVKKLPKVGEPGGLKIHKSPTFTGKLQ